MVHSTRMRAFLSLLGNRPKTHMGPGNIPLMLLPSILEIRWRSATSETEIFELADMRSLHWMDNLFKEVDKCIPK